jgi:hypothetical protein
VLRSLIGAALLALLAATGARAGGSPVAFVALPDRNEVVAVDLGTDRVLGRIAVAGGPEAVTAYYDYTRSRDFILVASPASGTVTLIDSVSRRIVHVWRGFAEPRAVAVNGLRAYVVDAKRGQLVVLGLGIRRVLTRIDVGARPTDVAVGDVAVVAHAGRASLTLVDVARRNVIGAVPTGDAVTSVSKQPDSANVYVSFAGSGRLALVDWGRRRTVYQRRVGGELALVVKDVYLRRVWATDRRNGRVLVAAARTGRVLRRLAGCPGAHGLAQVGTASIVATCPGNSTLAVWNTSRWRLRSISLGGRPAGVGIAVLP